MTTLGRSLRLLGRALRLRCPNCGRGPLLEGWLRVRPHCPVCGLRFERGEQGYQVGAYMFNLIAAELLFGAVFLAIVLLTWPSPPWTVLEYGGIAMMVIAPFVFYPFSKAIFLAFDLVFRPAALEELGRPAGDPPRVP